jgi:hypothetical protein
MATRNFRNVVQGWCGWNARKLDPGLRRDDGFMAAGYEHHLGLLPQHVVPA